MVQREHTFYFKSSIYLDFGEAESNLRQIAACRGSRGAGARAHAILRCAPHALERCDRFIDLHCIDMTMRNEAQRITLARTYSHARVLESLRVQRSRLSIFR